MKVPVPRPCSYLGMNFSAVHYPDGTWLEGEAHCYPNGGMKRRAYATCADGKRRVIRCGLPDTYFSITARGGFLSADDNGLKYTAVDKTTKTE